MTTVSVGYIRTLFDYHYWATNRLLDTAERLPKLQYAAAPLASHPSLHATLVHCMGAEIVWRSRWEGAAGQARMPSPAGFHSFADLRERWQSEEQAWRERLVDLTDEALADPVHYSNSRGSQFATPLWQVLVHVANHGTQHRSEAAAMLTILGHSPGDLDMILYFREH
jgi:uncharacterized damage-inducible protein DinB